MSPSGDQKEEPVILAPFLSTEKVELGPFLLNLPEQNAASEVQFTQYPA